MLFLMKTVSTHSYFHMKKMIVITVMSLLTLNISAQKITGTLKYASCLQLKEGLLLIGIDQEETFKAAVYDKNFNVQYSYSHKLPKDLEDARFNAMEEGDVIRISFCSNLFCTIGASMYLSRKLDFISLDPISKEDTKSARKLMEEQNKDSYVPAFTPSTGFGMSKKMYLKNDLFEVKYNDAISTGIAITNMNKYVYKGQPCIRRYERIANPKWAVYKSKWETNITFDKIEWDEFIHIDEKNLFVIVTNGDDKLGQDYVLRLDPGNGNIIFKTSVGFSGSDEGITIMEGYYDSLNQQVLVAGNYYDSKQKVKDIVMQGIVLFAINMKGEITKSQKIPFPEYEAKEPSGFNFKDKKVFVNRIARLSNGNYAMACQNTAKYFVRGGTTTRSAGTNLEQDVATEEINEYSIIGCSYYVFDKDFQIKGSNFFLYPRFSWKDCEEKKYYDVSGDCSVVVLQNLCGGVQEMEVVKFGSNNAVLKHLNSDKKGNSSVLPFLMNSNTIILFKAIGKNQYEFEKIDL